MAPAKELALAPWAVSVPGKSGQMRRKRAGEKRVARCPIQTGSAQRKRERWCLVLEKIAKEVRAESIASNALSLKTRVRDAEQLLTSCDCVYPP